MDVPYHVVQLEEEMWISVDRVEVEPGTGGARLLITSVKNFLLRNENP